jgi:hypothetical protein
VLTNIHTGYTGLISTFHTSPTNISPCSITLTSHSATAGSQAAQAAALLQAQQSDTTTSPFAAYLPHTPVRATAASDSAAQAPASASTSAAAYNFLLSQQHLAALTSTMTPTRLAAPADPTGTPSANAYLTSPMGQYATALGRATGNPFASPGGSVLDTLASLAASPQLSCSLYIKNLPANADKLFLYERFAPYGAVLSVKVLHDTPTGQCRGVGFVNFTDHASAVRAIQALHGTKVAGDKQLHVSLQQPRAIRPQL